MEKVKQILPLYCAGPIHTFVPFLEQNELVILDEVQFPNHAGYRNRIDFVGRAGKQSFSLPLVSSTRKANYKLVELSYQEHWQNHLINALKTAYGKSPFFEYYGYRIEDLIRKGHQYLWDFNFEFLEMILKCLKIETTLTITEGQLEEIGTITQVNELNYYQVFSQDIGFVSGLSILDLLFNEGIDAGVYLQSLKK